MPDFRYRYLGDTPKIFTSRREDEKLVKPGETVEADIALHHGELEPLSEPAMKHAEDNELALARDGGEVWQRPNAPKKPKPSVAPEIAPAPDAPKEA